MLIELYREAGGLNSKFDGKKLSNKMEQLTPRHGLGKKERETRAHTESENTHESSVRGERELKRASESYPEKSIYILKTKPER